MLKLTTLRTTWMWQTPKTWLNYVKTNSLWKKFDDKTIYCETFGTFLQCTPVKRHVEERLCCVLCCWKQFFSSAQTWNKLGVCYIKIGELRCISSSVLWPQICSCGVSVCGEVISLPTACLLHFCFLSLSQNPTIDRKCVLCVCVYGLDQCYSVHVNVPVHAHAYTHTHTVSTWCNRLRGWCS